MCFAQNKHSFYLKMQALEFTLTTSSSFSILTNQNPSDLNKFLSFSWMIGFFAGSTRNPILCVQNQWWPQQVTRSSRKKRKLSNS